MVSVVFLNPSLNRRWCTSHAFCLSYSTNDILMEIFALSETREVFCSIMEMEHARDDLMYEVHKLNQGNTEYEKNVSQQNYSAFAILIWIRNRLNAFLQKLLYLFSSWKHIFLTWKKWCKSWLNNSGIYVRVFWKPYVVLSKAQCNWWLHCGSLNEKKGGLNNLACLIEEQY